MTDSNDLTQIESHFEFGKNWASYATKIGEAEISEAVHGLERLLSGRLDGKRFLDIGCGSGLHSLAALQLGASEVLSVDLDSESVATTGAVLARYAPASAYRVERASILDLPPSVTGSFDFVYSWGVLHHTGDMRGALRNAAALVAPHGFFAFALYRRTWLCGFWKLEKRWYAGASARVQVAMRAIYVALFVLRFWLTGRSFGKYVRTYRGARGMDYYHDVHDWLGGYPYESISPEDVDLLMNDLGFKQVRAFAQQGRFFGRDLGFFGSGCDEFVYVRSEN